MPRAALSVKLAALSWLPLGSGTIAKGQNSMNLSLPNLLWSQLFRGCCTAHSQAAVTLRWAEANMLNRICLSNSPFVLLAVAAAVKGDNPFKHACQTC